MNLVDDLMYYLSLCLIAGRIKHEHLLLFWMFQLISHSILVPYQASKGSQTWELYDVASISM